MLLISFLRTQATRFHESETGMPRERDIKMYRRTVLFVAWLPAGDIGGLVGFLAHIYRVQNAVCILVSLPTHSALRSKSCQTFTRLFQSFTHVHTTLYSPSPATSSFMPGAGDLLLSLRGPAMISVAAPLYR